MAIENRRMQQRYGSYDRFKTDKGKHLPNEFLSVTSGDPNSGTGKGLYFAFTPSEVEQLMTRENGKKLVDDASDEIRNNFLSDIRTAISQSQSATLNISVLTEQIKAAIEEANASSEEARNTIWNNKNLTNNSSDTEITVETVHAPAVLRMVKGKTEQKNIKGINLAKYSTSGHNKNIGDLEKGKIYTMFWKQDYEGTDYGFNLRYGSSVESLQIATTKKYIGKLTKALFTAPENGILYFNGYRKANQREIMLVEGDLYDTAENIPFEPYTGNKPAPNPEFPQAVQGVGGSTGDSGFKIEVEAQGKNLFNALATSYSSGAEKITVSELGNRIVVTGKNRYCNYYFSVPELKGKTVTIQLDSITNNGYAGCVQLVYRNQGIATYNRIGTDIKKKSVSIPSSSDDVWIRIYPNNTDVASESTVTLEIKGLRIYESNEEIAWMPYEHSTLSIPLTTPLFDGDKLCMVKAGESYTDSAGITQTADRDLWGVYRNTFVLSSKATDTAWTFEAGSKRILRNDLTKAKKYANNEVVHGKSNCFEAKSANQTYQKKKGFSIDSNGRLLIYLNEFGGLDEFKRYMGEKEMIFVLPLEIPYFEPFADQTPFTQFYSADVETTFYTTDPLQPVLTIDSAKTPEGAMLLSGYVQALQNAQKQEDAVQTAQQQLASTLSLLPLETQAAMIQNDVNKRYMEVMKNE